ncbi:MAG: glutamine--fructose-6-phosphate transaminase (isomerizing) [SAR202 cluster bacterium]|nr:glutamine--fructose-6-phosphate transaminase (isomerizing) [SAR202 cluster bacterium]
MCGIFGYVGDRQATPLLLEGLQRLEYRGYDSAGIATVDDRRRLDVRKATGKLANLIGVVQQAPLAGTVGIGHTRWATHGEPNDTNAHPHLGGSGKVVVVHNGIVENYQELKDNLIARGHRFDSATDSEVIPHLIEDLLDQGKPFPEAVRLAALQLKGAHAIAGLHADTPNAIVALRIGNAGGVVVGHGPGECYVSSDLPALVSLTPTVTSLAPGQMAVVRANGCDISTLSGERVPLQKQTMASNPIVAAKGGYRHFMLKEIMEQPEVAMSALRGRLAFDPGSVTLGEVPFTPDVIRSIARVVLLGMGTSLHATQLGARFIERLARLPASAENAAEFRYRDPVVDKDTLVVAITQSGETADTLEALNEARRHGALTLAICNVPGSQVTRIAHGTMLMHAGPEIGVASTKAFTNSLVCLLLLAGHLGATRGHLRDEAVRDLVDTIARMPGLMGQALEMNATAFGPLAAEYARYRRFLFIGRGLLEPIAREGALKFKEVSYIHAEGMAAAELKHGPIALVDPETPVVAIALKDALYEKMVGNIHAVRARKGPVLAIATVGDEIIAEHANHVLWVPAAPPLLAPMVATIPLQLFAYHTAVYCGSDVDQPRNLAKSVTVE